MRTRKTSKTESIQKAIFDPKSRLYDGLIRLSSFREYLTGFEKRNKLKKQKIRETKRKLEQEMRREKRKHRRQKMAKAVEELIAKIGTTDRHMSQPIRVETYEISGSHKEDHEEFAKNATVTIEPFLASYQLSLFCLLLLPKLVPKMPKNFKLQYNLQERQQKSQRLRIQYPDRIPVICERLSSSDLPDLISERFLVPGDFTVGNLTTVIRNRIKIGAEKSIFLFVANSLLPAHQLMAAVYQQRQDQDGFLYVLYSGENTFGQ